MKTTLKTALLGLTLLGLGTTAKAQEVTYGLQIGSNYHMTSFGNKSVKDNSAKIGVSVAGFARIGDNLFFQPGIGASLLRKEYSFDKSQKTLKFYQINLPLQVGYKIINKKDFNLRGMLGPQLNYDIKTTKSTATTDYKKFSYDGRIGLGVDISRLTLDAYYSHGLSRVDKTLDAKNRTIGVMVGYKF
ncbi:PorT family protein [Sphingobacterium sp. SRCM116780]|uniref:porin family protein n=1 Tax=Sphingobacterium sp. SRCM116780 TaxID=2907623 RepID=UPI001F176608|nr:porin family protein [Sphingobacterium sp. SRCM116780]UIR57064.1 PorT family protein [Sphingobacterium sp. SRCM116780]